MAAQGRDSILEKLDALPQVRAFDAFPKTQPLYTTRSTKGGLFTLAVAFVLAWLAWGEMTAYIYGKPAATFGVDHDVGSEMQVNFDITVAMKCHCEPTELPRRHLGASRRTAKID